MFYNEDTEATIGISREEKYGRLELTYVAIVQCKDCKHAEEDCEIAFHFGEKDDWFCADGERKC